MERVLVFGEALIDLYFGETDRRTRGNRAFQLVGTPGGAPMNVAAQLAALDTPVSFLSAFADDGFGIELRRMLEERGVDLSLSWSLAGERTPLAMVSTSPQGENLFRFYGTDTAMDKFRTHMLSANLWQNADWFHFCGVVPAFTSGAEMTQHLVAEAKRRGVTLSYDVNARPDLWRNKPAEANILLQLTRGVDVLKVSSEDLDWLRATVDADLVEPESLLTGGCRLVVYTQGEKGARLITSELQVDVPPPDVDVVEETGAGDAFSAGLIVWFKENAPSEGGLGDLTEERLRQAGRFATAVAGRILSQRGAIPS